MSLESRINQDLKEAMKRRDELATGVLRMLKSQLVLEKTKKERTGADLEDEVAVEVFRSYAKKLAEAIEQFRQGGREEMARRHEQELELVRGYLPQSASEEEILRVIDQVIEETGASTAAELGKVMRPVLERLQGRAEGKEVNRLVRERLNRD